MRDPDSLKLLGFAPIYDSGNSMFYNVPMNRLCSIHLESITTHSFIRREVELLKYVSDRSVVNLDKIYDDFTIYNHDIEERQSRIPIIKKLYHAKIEHLKAFQAGQDIWKRRK